VPGQVEDHEQAAARLVGGQVADLDDAFAGDGLRGDRRDALLDRRIELALEEQAFVACGTPAGGSDEAAGFLEEDEVRSEGADLCVIAFSESAADEGFSLLAARCARGRMGGDDPLSALFEGVQHVSLGQLRCGHGVFRYFDG